MNSLSVFPVPHPGFGVSGFHLLYYNSAIRSLNRMEPRRHELIKLFRRLTAEGGGDQGGVLLEVMRRNPPARDLPNAFLALGIALIAKARNAFGLAGARTRLPNRGTVYLPGLCPFGNKDERFQPSFRTALAVALGRELNVCRLSGIGSLANAGIGKGGHSFQ